jgi:hypothetical protein
MVAPKDQAVLETSIGALLDWSAAGTRGAGAEGAVFEG